MPIIRLDIPQELATRLWQIDVDAAHILELGPSSNDRTLREK